MAYQRNLLDRTFEISIILKGLDGIIEIIGGSLLLIISPNSITGLVHTLTKTELEENPHSFLATHLVHASNTLVEGSRYFAAFYLLSHGLVKVVLVAALLKEKLWAYPWMVAFLILFIFYQIYILFFDRFTLGITFLTIFDAFIVWLTILEYKKHKLQHAEHVKTDSKSHDS